MSLIQRLRNLQETVTVSETDITHLTLDMLAEATIDFGQKHLGKTYTQAWEDQSWVAFMVTRYSKSVDMKHRRFIRFVDLMVQKHEQEQLPIPVPVSPAPSGRSGSSFTMITPKAKGTPKAKARSAPLYDEEDVDVESVMYNSETMISHHPMPQEEMSAMQQRMLHLEDALTRVIQHLDMRLHAPATEAEQ